MGCSVTHQFAYDNKGQMGNMTSNSTLLWQGIPGVMSFQLGLQYQARV
jgi:hypothetical protein